MTKTHLFSSIYALLIYFFSEYVFLYFVNGDQFHYIRYYNGLSGLGIAEAFVYYEGALSSLEPGYFLITYFASDYLDKSFIVSLANAAIAYILCRYLLRNRVNALIVCLLLFLNFYLFVLFYSAERLKFSVLFFLLALLYGRNFRAPLLLMSLVTHVQVLLLFVSNFTLKNKLYLRDFYIIKSGMRLFGAIIGVSVIISALVYLSPYMISKVAKYSSSGNEILSIVKPLIFSSVAIFYAKGNRLGLVIALFPLWLASLVVGGDRIVIFVYFVFLYIALKVNRGFNIPVILTSVYFAIKGVFFMMQVFTLGDGFGHDGAV